MPRLSKTKNPPTPPKEQIHFRMKQFTNTRIAPYNILFDFIRVSSLCSVSLTFSCTFYCLCFSCAIILLVESFTFHYSIYTNVVCVCVWCRGVWRGHRDLSKKSTNSNLQSFFYLPTIHIHMDVFGYIWCGRENNFQVKITLTMANGLAYTQYKHT